MLAGQVVIAGAVTSRTVTVATQTAVLPAPSVTVSVILLSPTCAQPYVVLAGANDSAAGQLSDEPPFIWEGTTVTEPAEDRFTVTSLHTAFGICTSCTVMVKVQLDVLPAASVAR